MLSLKVEIRASQVAQWLRNRLQCRRLRFDPWVTKIPWRRKWQSAPVILPGKSHGQRSLVGYSPQGHKELDMNEATSACMTEVVYDNKTVKVSMD